MALIALQHAGITCAKRQMSGAMTKRLFWDAFGISIGDECMLGFTEIVCPIRTHKAGGVIGDTINRK